MASPFRENCWNFLFYYMFARNKKRAFWPFLPKKILPQKVWQVCFPAIHRCFRRAHHNLEQQYLNNLNRNYGPMSPLCNHCSVYFQSSLHENWFVSNIYGPCSGDLRDDFVSWMYNLEIDTDKNWIFMGDFNFVRSVENRIIPGGDMNDIIIFNEIISKLGLIEIPLKGMAYTWSKMQDQPLLQQLDWVFTSPAWTLIFPTPQSQLCQSIYLTTLLVWWALKHQYQRQKSSDLKTFGWIYQASWTLFKTLGTYRSKATIKQLSWMEN